MRLHHPAPLAAMVLATAAMTGCGDAAPPAKAGPNTTAAATTSAKDPSAARDKRNARHPDKTPNDIRKTLEGMGMAKAQEMDSATGFHKRLTVGDLVPLLGQPYIPQSGPYAGACIFPNVCYDGHFVKSYLVQFNLAIDNDDRSAALGNWVTTDKAIEYVPPGSPLLQNPVAR